MPLELCTVGVKEYAWPTAIWATGVPLIDIAVGELGAELLVDAEDELAEALLIDAAEDESAAPEEELPPWQPASASANSPQSSAVRPGKLLRRRVCAMCLSPRPDSEAPIESRRNSNFSDKGIAVDDELHAREDSSATPLSRAVASRPEALRLRLAADLPHALEVLNRQCANTYIGSLQGLLLVKTELSR